MLCSRLIRRKSNNTKRKMRKMNAGQRMMNARNEEESNSIQLLKGRKRRKKAVFSPFGQKMCGRKPLTRVVNVRECEGWTNHILQRLSSNSHSLSHTKLPAWEEKIKLIKLRYPCITYFQIINGSLSLQDTAWLICHFRCLWDLGGFFRPMPTQYVHAHAHGPYSANCLQLKPDFRISGNP